MVVDELVIILCAFSLMAFFFGISKGRDFCDRLLKRKDTKSDK